MRRSVLCALLAALAVVAPTRESPSGGVAGAAAAQTDPAPAGGSEARMARGKAVFEGVCATCHQLDGRGRAPLFPPLAKSDFLMADKERSIRIVLEGLRGPVRVNGQTYDNVMPPFPQMSDLLTFVRNAFGNRGEPVEVAEVAAVRASAGGQP
jgi:mono/diheme cytochrome c family protein